ncbi:MAG: hypothetical protein UCH28_11195 [Adlercreutzia sp.]|nr:hypothetical protein [Adlercreutzia sp.]
MREIDHDGLMLCNIQGEMFRKSAERASCSSPIFIRRFMNSNVAERMDTAGFLTESSSPESLFRELEEEYGESTYGTVKYSPGVLFWMGYVYRYWAYTRNQSSSAIYRIIGARELSKLFAAYHTLDPGQAIERIMEAQGIETGQSILSVGVETLRRIREKSRFEYGVVTLKEHNGEEASGSPSAQIRTERSSSKNN